MTPDDAPIETFEDALRGRRLLQQEQFDTATEMLLKFMDAAAPDKAKP